MSSHITPNLFILGAPKAGTTALAQYLGEHPQAFITTPKEPFYLCDDYPDLRTQHALNTDADYLRLFTKGKGCTVRGEASTNYLRSTVAIARALEINPKARFICLIRDPVEIAHAFHSEQIYARNETEDDFETAWRLQQQRSKGEAIPETCRAPEFLQYRQVSMVGSQLKRAMGQIDEERLLVIFQVDLAADTRAVYEQACIFLGLAPYQREHFPRANSSHAHRSAMLARLILSPPGFAVEPMNRMRQHFRIQRPWYIEMVKAWQKVPNTRTELSSALFHELREEFAHEVKVVGQLTGRSPESWIAQSPKEPSSVPK